MAFAAAAQDPVPKVVSLLRCLVVPGLALFVPDIFQISLVERDQSKSAQDFGLCPLKTNSSGIFYLPRLVTRRVIGSIICAAAQNIGMLVAGRFINGFAVGICSAQVPVYISELAPPSRRGRLVGLQQWAITWGKSSTHFRVKDSFPDY